MNHDQPSARRTGPLQQLARASVETPVLATEIVFTPNQETTGANFALLLRYRQSPKEASTAS